ncbi:MAG: hypothetical protein MI749_02595 [Desulfovibrionales bacterium]|nr:hypothetical protein [Desulfovibrionales bacterium]
MPVGKITPRDIANVIITAGRSGGVPVVDSSKPEGVAVLKKSKYNRLSKNDDGSANPVFGRITKALVGKHSIDNYLTYRNDSKGALNTLLHAYEKDMSARYGSMAHTIMDKARSTFRDASDVSDQSLRTFESDAYSIVQRMSRDRSIERNNLMSGKYDGLLGTPSKESAKILIDIIGGANPEQAGFAKLTANEQQFVSLYQEAARAYDDEKVSQEFRLAKTSESSPGYEWVQRDVAAKLDANEQKRADFRETMSEAVMDTQPRFTRPRESAVANPRLREVDVPYNREPTLAPADRPHTEKHNVGLQRTLSFNSLVEAAAGLPQVRTIHKQSDTGLVASLEELGGLAFGMYHDNDYDLSGITVRELNLLRSRLANNQSEPKGLDTILLLDSIVRADAFKHLDAQLERVEEGIDRNRGTLFQYNNKDLIFNYNAQLHAVRKDADVSEGAQAAAGVVTALKGKLKQGGDPIRIQSLNQRIARGREQVNAFAEDKRRAAQELETANQRLDMTLASSSVSDEERDAVKELRSLHKERELLVALNGVKKQVQALSIGDTVSAYANVGADTLDVLYQGDSYYLKGAEKEQIEELATLFDKAPAEAFDNDGATAILRMRASGCFAHLEERKARVEQLLARASDRFRELPEELIIAYDENEEILEKLNAAGEAIDATQDRLKILQEQYRNTSDLALREQLELDIERAEDDATDAQAEFDAQLAETEGRPREYRELLLRSDRKHVGIITRVNDLKGEQDMLNALTVLRKSVNDVAERLGV